MLPKNVVSSCLIVIFNLLYTLSGLYALIISENAKNFYQNHEPFIIGCGANTWCLNYTLPSNILRAASLLTILASLITYLYTSPSTNNKVQFCVYSVKYVSIYVAVVLELTVFIMGYSLETKIKSSTSTIIVNRSSLMMMTNKNYSSINTDDNDFALTFAWDVFQTTHKCCGVISYRDWHDPIIRNNYTELELDELTLPVSCCPISYRCTAKSAYLRGCSAIFTQLSRFLAVSLWRAGIETVFMQILASVMLSYLNGRQ